jgi:hypothetical protein
MKRLAIASLSSLLSACTFVNTQGSTYFTFGQARVEECAQVVQVDDKEQIKFNCKRFESDGLSAEFTTAFGFLVGWIPWPF